MEWKDSPQLTQSYRFGRRITLPSTVQIRHELGAPLKNDFARERCAEADGLPLTASWDEVIAHRQERAIIPFPETPHE